MEEHELQIKVAKTIKNICMNLSAYNNNAHKKIAKEIIELVRKKDKEKQFLFRCWKCDELKPRKGSHIHEATCADCAKKLTISKKDLNKPRLHFGTGVEAEQNW